MQRTLFWPASWLPAVDKSRGPKSVEVQRVWEVYDGRVQFMSRQDALLLDESLNAGDVSQAWLVWSVLLKLHLRMPIGFPVVLPLIGVCFPKPQHTSWDYLCMLVHVFGRGCTVLGILVFQLLIARGGVAISMIWRTVLFIPGPG